MPNKILGFAVAVTGISPFASPPYTAKRPVYDGAPLPTAYWLRAEASFRDREVVPLRLLCMGIKKKPTGVAAPVGLKSSRRTF